VNEGAEQMTATDSNWHRLAYWLGQNWPAVVQAVCAVVTVGLTAVLAWLTKKYIELTANLAANADRQTKILVQPNLHIASSVQGIEYFPGRKYYQGDIVLHNKGPYPVLITGASVSFQENGTGELVERKLHRLLNCVIPAGEDISERLRVDEWLKSDDDLGPFHDFLTTTIDCRDMAGVCCCRYGYQPATGLSYTPLN
jgi:hypothetical protein